MQTILQRILTSSKLHFLIAAIAAYSASAKTADHFPTECLGPETASDNLIFLHAILTADEMKGPLPYQTELQILAQKLNIRIATPRSTILCKTGDQRYCWGSENPDSIKLVYNKIRQSSAKCFKTPDRFILAGFSNGGYHATRAAMLCLSPQPSHILAFGSAGNPALLKKGERKNCAPVFLAIGNRDITASKARAFAKSFSQRGGVIQFEEFAGGHDLPVDLFMARLKTILNR
jgi:predicted esterase